METQKILVVFGTRPEAIKLAPLIRKLRENKNIEVRVCSTGQHKEMLLPVLTAFEIWPEYNLNIMTESQTLDEIFTNITTKFTSILSEFVPHTVIVHGDTATTFAASLASFYKKINVAHVEAGLRTHNNYFPWPEEVNRRLTSVIARYHFAPTEAAKKNLLDENIPDELIEITGNTIIDALKHALKILDTNDVLRGEVMDLLAKYKINYDKKIILVTGHRRENFGTRMQNICLALKDISETLPDVQIIYPVHLNPNVQSPVKSLLSELPNVLLLPPLDYFPFIFLMNKSHIIITDSGGIQEEAPSLGKPVLVTRDQTERPEAIYAGTIKLVGADREKIFQETLELLQNNEKYEIMSKRSNPFGDGTASEKIVKFLTD